MSFLDLTNAFIIDCEGNFLFDALRNKNIYTINIIDLTNQSIKCFVALEDNSSLWHKRLGYVNFDLISKLSNKGLVRGLPTLKKPKEVTCNEYKKNKLKVLFIQ